MGNPEEKNHDTDTKPPVNNNLVYPNPNATSGPAILSMKIVEEDEKEQPAVVNKPKKWYSIVSFILTLIPIILCAYCLVYYYANKKPDTIGTDFTGLVFSYMIIYYYSIGFPAAVFAIGLGIKGLKNELPQLAKFSLFLKAFYIFIVILFMCGAIRF